MEQIKLTGGIVKSINLGHNNSISSVTIISTDGKEYTLSADSEYLDVFDKNNEFVYEDVI